MAKTLAWHPALPARPAGTTRRAVVRLLRLTERAVADWAARLTPTTTERPVPAADAPQLEFYAESGAPEGALYVGGRYVGVLPGVTRL